MGRQKGALQRSDVSTSRIVDLYKSGKTTYEIATIVGLAQPTISLRLRMVGFKARTRWEHYAKIPLADAIELYRSGLNGCEVARAAGVTPHAVRCQVRKAGIKIRPAKARPRFGPDHPSWIGGRYLRDDGYIWIRVGKRNKAEHRIFMEQHLGRPLKKGEIVHHLNGIRHDNRLENLTVTTLKDHEHYTYVKALQSRIRTLENLLISASKTVSPKSRELHFQELSPAHR